ncbi:MAG TPA: SDR family oxidoreductase [Terriglobales bacterium]|jgi:NAD(P)-dependent dehydrogenase (short-subunit alcohol dehydrogenase family)|nr:SDR family oxidoreductase [Terriglobales bacterium]
MKIRKQYLGWMAAAGTGAAVGTVVAGTAAALGVALVSRELLRRVRSTDLKGKVVMITGGSKGLGFAMAQQFARRGGRIVICARNPEPLEQARRELEQQGVEVLAEQCDVTDPRQVERLVAEANRRFGRVDVLVNNAGIITVGPLETQRREDFEEAMNVMFWGAVNPALAVLPQMLERGRGHIVNITSIGGRVSVPHLLPYNCAKFALVGFSEGLRAELAKDGIRVTTVVPGLMRTGSHLNALFKGQHRAEYTWFSLSATSPLTSMSARRAAAAVVRAVARGDSDVVLTPQAKLLALVHGLFPGLTAEVLALANRLLPTAAGAGAERHTGKQSRTRVTDSFLTALGRAPAQKLHQVG